MVKNLMKDKIIQRQALKSRSNKFNQAKQDKLREF